MPLAVSKKALDAGFKELEMFSSMVDFAPRDQVNKALEKVFIAMYQEMFPATAIAESGVDSGEAEA